jgi:hypothetical protein
MKRLLGAVPPAIFVFLLGSMAACDLQEPERYIRAPVIKSYSPRASVFSAAVGDSLRFSILAEDPYNQNLGYRFFLGDSVACESGEWTYVVEDTGAVDVAGVATNGVSESAIRWRVFRLAPVNLPPQIVDWQPRQTDISMIVADAMEFVITAVDPEGKPLSYVYTVNDAIVAVSRRYVYEPTSVGLFEVRALVTDGETFASHSWNVHVAAEPDSTPPAQVVIRSIGPGPETGEVDIEWVAVGDDSMTGLPSYYVVRTSPVPIDDEYKWSASSNRDGEPAPAPPGEIMRMTVRNLPPAQTVFVALRAVDDFGLISPLSPLASTRARGIKISGTIRDAVTNAPLEGIRVSLLTMADTTSADGTFALAELPAGESFIRIEDEPWRTEIGDYFDVVISPYTIKDKDVVNVWMLPNIDIGSALYSNFLDYYKKMTKLEACPKDLLGRWDIPCKVYVPPLVQGDLDYRQVIIDAFLEWEDLIGLDVFEFVESVPDRGVYVTYGEPNRDFYIIMQRDADCLPVLGRINLTTGYAAGPDSLLNLVARHEIGHALRLNHSLDNAHIMYDSPGVRHPAPLEVSLVRAMYRIPRALPADWLRED